MELKQIANALGIEVYPDALDELYRTLTPNSAPACDLELIDRLETEHAVFGEYYRVVRETAVKINQDPVRSAWVRVAAQYALACDPEQATEIPEPVYDGTAMNDLMLLYILLPQIPGSIEGYTTRGFSEEELADLLNAYKGSIRILENRTGRPGINKAYYRWLLHFSKVQIFKTMGLQFALGKLPNLAVWLRNRTTGQLVPVMTGGTFHASGVQQLGSLGYTDEADAFSPVFSEDAENYYGHGAFENVVDVNCRTFPKRDWQCVTRPRDKCLIMHIPRGADITREVTLKACRSAFRILRERFPEENATMVFCASWLLNPTLKQIQGENSRITQFMECFTKYPNRDPAGKAVLGFVFGKQYENYADLPENTSLQRKLKQLYLSGKCLHSYSGAIYVEE